MRKLILTAVMALAMTALLATSASAAVEVRNGNGELCATEATCEVTFDGEVKITPADPEDYVLKYHCYAEWTIDVSGDGTLLLENADFEPYSLYEYCQSPTWAYELGFCGDDPQPGVITQAGDDDYVGPGHTEPIPGWHIEHYNAVFDTCWRSGYDNWQSGTSGKMRFDVTDYEVPSGYEQYRPPLSWTFAEQLAFPNVPTGHPGEGATIELIGSHQLPAEGLRITPVE
jgi:hypothetical protein